ncbi:MAG TPA: hypothetical protein VJN18_27230 [Polyangiaceae bacterium]|nr:hypothetical protein [Polyangiaceae bacterium]
MVATGPLLLAIALLTKDGTCNTVNRTLTEAELDDCQNDTRTYALAIGGVALIAGGIPLIVIGSEKVPATTAKASIGPWLSPDLAGVKLQLDL